eukprot:6469614-Amphidinium_carterae.1
MVATIVKAAELLDVNVLGPDGNQRFGGHSLSIGGAYWLAAQGVELYSRLSSWVAGSRHWCSSERSGARFEASWCCFRATENTGVRDWLRQEVLDAAASAVSNPQQESVLNLQSGAVHKVAYRNGGPKNWIAKRGWRFGSSDFKLLGNVSGERHTYCERCHPKSDTSVSWSACLPVGSRTLGFLCPPTRSCNIVESSGARFAPHLPSKNWRRWVSVEY